MAKELKLQDPGEGIHEVEIKDVLVARGDTVGEGDPVLVVESDKAAIEIPAPYSGTVQSIDVEAGDTAVVGDVLMTFAVGDAAPAEEAGEAEAAGEDDEGPDKTETADDEREAPEEADASREDEASARAEAAKTEKEGEAAEAAEPAGSDGEGDVVPASPLARRVAAQEDVDLHEVEPSGPHGRVLLDDVRAHAAAGEDRAEAERPEPPAEPERDKARALPDFARWGPVERQPLRSIRRATARQMARAWAAIPHVTHQDVADITELEGFRRRRAAAVEAEGGKLTMTVFALEAAVAALKEQPRFNASLDAETDEIVVKKYFHIGVAVETEEGLLVPVVRDVDRKSALELAIELPALAERARSGELDRAAMQGGSFTVTNVGALGGTGFTPIINHPEVAILGLGRATWQPVVRGEPPIAGSDEPHGETGGGYSIEPRLLLPLSVAFDHRVVDGAAAARFTRRIATALADVESLALVA